MNSNTIKLILTNGTIIEFPVGTTFSATINNEKISFGATSSSNVEPVSVNKVPKFCIIRDYNGIKRDSWGNYNGKIPCIKFVREMSSLGLGEAKAIVENHRPFEIGSCISLDFFNAECNRLFRDFGIKVESYGY